MTFSGPGMKMGYISVTPEVNTDEAKAAGDPGHPSHPQPWPVILHPPSLGDGWSSSTPSLRTVADTLEGKNKLPISNLITGPAFPEVISNPSFAHCAGFDILCHTSLGDSICVISSAPADFQLCSPREVQVG